MAVGKRTSTDQPLTEHDIAERLDKAAERVLRILMDVRQQEGDLFDAVRQSRYHTNVMDLLAKELRLWMPPDVDALTAKVVARLNVKAIEGRADIARAQGTGGYQAVIRMIVEATIEAEGGAL